MFSTCAGKWCYDYRMLLEPHLPTLGSTYKTTCTIHEFVPKRRIWFAILKYNTSYFVIGKFHKNTIMQFAFRWGGYAWMVRHPFSFQLFAPDIKRQWCFFSILHSAQYVSDVRSIILHVTWYVTGLCSNVLRLQYYAIGLLPCTINSQRKTYLRLMLGSMNLKMGAETNSVAVT